MKKQYSIILCAIVFWGSSTRLAFAFLMIPTRRLQFLFFTYVNVFVFFNVCHMCSDAESSLAQLLNSTVQNSRIHRLRIAI